MLRQAKKVGETLRRLSTSRVSRGGKGHDHGSIPEGVIPTPFFHPSSPAEIAQSKKWSYGTVAIISASGLVVGYFEKKHLEHSAHHPTAKPEYPFYYNNVKGNPWENPQCGFWEAACHKKARAAKKKNKIYDPKAEAAAIIAAHGEHGEHGEHGGHGKHGGHGAHEEHESEEHEAGEVEEHETSEDEDQSSNAQTVQSDKTVKAESEQSAEGDDDDDE